MSEPSFLSVEQVEWLHEVAINRFGGSHGLRDPLLLEGAVLHPRNVYYYGQGDLFDVAAAYAFHISEAQAFLDGNKRTAIAAALVFLEGNGVTIRKSVQAGPLLGHFSKSDIRYWHRAFVAGAADSPRLSPIQKTNGKVRLPEFSHF